MLYLDLYPAIADVGSNAQKRRMVFFGWRKKEFFRTNLEEHFFGVYFKPCFESC